MHNNTVPNTLDDFFISAISGYPWMVRDYNFFRTYWKMYSSMPDLVKKSIYHTSRTFLNSPKQLLVLDYIRRATYGDQFYWGGSSIFSPSHMEGLFNKQYHYLNSIPAAFAGSLHEQALSFKPDADYLQRIAFVELSERLSEILLMRVDKIGMAHSLEARVPFLDHRLVEFTMSIPPHIKVPDKKSTKYILKKAVEPILPHEIIYRKKQGFWAPVKEWIRNQWFDYTSAQLMDSRITNMDIFNKDSIRVLLDNHRTGKHNNGVQLFSLLTLSLWYDRFFK